MRIQSFNQELTYANICFAQLFRNITINRKENDSEDIIPVKVDCVLGSRSRIIKALENQQEKADFTLPLIAIMRTGMRRDPSRLSNMHNEIRQSVNGKIDYNMVTPNPIDISYKVTIFAKYQSDIDLILSNWIPFFNNDVWVSVKHYKYTDLKFYSQIVMDDNISETRNESPTNTQYDFCQAECTFTFKTYIFGGNQRVYSGLHQIPHPVTMITTVLNPDATNPDDPSAWITTIITADPDDPNHNSEPSAEGFIPIIQSVHFELHAVPRADPYMWEKYHLIKYLDIGTYFDEVDAQVGLTADGKEKFQIVLPEYDNLDWMFIDMSADLITAKNEIKTMAEHAPYQYQWTKGNMTAYNDYRQ